MDTPENWTWADGPVEPGPCAVIDVDGVLADGWHRQRFLQNGKKDWKNFFANAYQDTPIEGSIELLESLAPTVVLLTSRPDNLRSVTLEWLAKHGYRWELLVMRGPQDRRYSSPDFKRRSLEAIQGYGFEPLFAMDDDQRNIDMFRSTGLPALYVHSGYYEA